MTLRADSTCLLIVLTQAGDNQFMAYNHYVRCPKCGKIVAAENQTPLWVLALGRTNLTINCCNCGYSKKFHLLSAKKFESLSVSDEIAAQELDSNTSKGN